MKKITAILLSVMIVLSLVGCGSSSQAPHSSPSAGAEAPGASVPEEEATVEVSGIPEKMTVDMLYFKKLGDTSIMAACYTDEGVAQLGSDYYVIHVGDAKIYNTQGEEISLDQLTRGCEIQIQWPGMVMESYPGQISAEIVTALSDEASPAVPPEDEIQPIDGGVKWWEEEPVTEVPALDLEYTTPDFSCQMIVEPRYGSWSYGAAETGTSGSGGASNALLDGQSPWDWDYDDNHTVKRSGFDSMVLSTAPAAEEMTVTAYAVDQPDAEGAAVELDEQGTLHLLDGDYIYVIHAKWNSEQYQGEATYGFLVTAQ